VLTSISVVLGVAFMSGTFVLTDTSARVRRPVLVQQATDIDAGAGQAGAGRRPTRDGAAQPVPEHAHRCSRPTGRRKQRAVQGIAIVVGRR
jgi:hypothetical protein